MNDTYTVTTVTVYRVDGPHGRADFDDQRNALSQLAVWERIDAANAILDDGGTLGEAQAAMGLPCPPKIEAVTRAHGFKISHWQCTDLYAYSIGRFDSHGRLYVGGVGGWSGHYGQYVSLAALARHPFRLGIETDPRAAGGAK